MYLAAFVAGVIFGAVGMVGIAAAMAPSEFFGDDDG